MYEFDSRIRYSEIDHHERITLPGIINYFQDCSIFHSESIGFGIERLKKEGRAWILSSWQIVVNRYPVLGETVKVCTWPKSFKGAIGERNFQMLDKDGRIAACANSIWVYMDINRKRPVKPSQEEMDGYGMEASLDMEYASRKIQLPESFAEGKCMQVQRYHIDTNEHVNNCQYVQIALEALEEEIKVRQVRVDYKKSAVYQDIILPRIAKEEERIVVELCDREGKLYAVVEFIGE